MDDFDGGDYSFLDDDVMAMLDLQFEPEIDDDMRELEFDFLSGWSNLKHGQHVWILESTDVSLVDAENMYEQRRLTLARMQAAMLPQIILANQRALVWEAMAMYAWKMARIEREEADRDA